ncbi:acetylglutamate kinase [Priestia flexa]|uniref:acetylglutamate kinase n=1 Tax=Priestia flexa TaxID=86664 RepID=UPI001B32276D|nr:acetylglutamate kinase [Priestia flexa]
MSDAKTIVIKCGGSIINQLTNSFFRDLKKLIESGHNIVLVHGGGPDIANMLAKLDIKAEFVDGLRRTSKEALDVVTMVLSGKVNKQLVRDIQIQGLQAIGLSGCDAQLLEAEAIDFEKLGYVGEVVSVNENLLKQLIEKSYIPVISSIGVNSQGEMFNINADVAAGSIAKALGAQKLMFVTDVQGVLKDQQLLTELTVEEVSQLIEEKTIYGGMIPKVMSAVKALSPTLHEVNIISGINGFLDQSGNLVGTTIKHIIKGGEDKDELVISNVSTS